MSDELKPCPVCSNPPMTWVNGLVVCEAADCKFAFIGISRDAWTSLPRRDDATCKQSLQVDAERDRRWFEAACAAMAGTLAGMVSTDSASKRAVEFADALLAELEKPR